jgi:hypothetical protein
MPDIKSVHSTYKSSGAAAALTVMKNTTSASEAQIPARVTANHLSDQVRLHTDSDGRIDWVKVHRALVSLPVGAGEGV